MVSKTLSDSWSLLILAPTGYEEDILITTFTLSKKKGKARWLMPILPARWEAKVGELLKAISLRL